MTDASVGPVLPDSFEAQWDDDRFWYREVCDVPGERDPKKVASQTEYSLNLLANEAELPEEAELKVDVECPRGTGLVVAEIELWPGKPDGMEYIGLAMLTSELMTQVLGHDKEMFEDIVGTAVMTTGREDFKSLLMNEVLPDTTLPDEN